jgi:hypothetical protein
MALDVWFGLVQLAISSQSHPWVVGWLAVLNFRIASGSCCAVKVISQA